MLDRSLEDSGIDCVKVNNTESSYLAVEKLYDYGHRRIAIIGSDVEITGKERLDGYLQFLNDKKIHVPAQYIKLGAHSIEHGYKSMQELLELEVPPTAVFMGNFEIILGAVPRLIFLIGDQSMLKNNPPIISPELLSVLDEMGHGHRNWHRQSVRP